MQHVDSDNNSSDYEVIFQDDFTDIDISYDTEEILYSDSDEESKLLYLTKMRFSEAEASIAMKKCGSDSSIAELTDFICADQMAKIADVFLMVEDRKPLCNDPNYKQRRNLGYDLWKRKKQRKLEKKLLNEDDHAVHLLIPMIGSVVPTKPDHITQRTLPEDAIEPPYFYYEQIHLPNLMIGSAKLTERICKALEAYGDNETPSSVQKYVLDECLKMESEVAFYCLGILLKTDVQELNDDRLEQLMSSFVKFNLVAYKGRFCSNVLFCAISPQIQIQQSSEGHNEYHLDKENDQHRRSSNNVSRLEPASRYNQSAGSDLFIAL
ncbi:DNA (Cytosine-5)-methyltransferase DRM1/2 isoform 4 [Hibiscus syriacus]|uniref:DNA (Cytosine-5)-methyltransferase DRM1/2 isoform 4 n=1 Tax=Hibiscus syriacus TaxID=106335 RepID=A0A6A3CL03_HIBSY|nr:DNA (Cytosine-5)-methyltransferase DRM1/2 isoform 4 [Hibiscus syriacus]